MEDIDDDARSQPAQTTFDHRFAAIRRIVVFLLGVAVVVDALFDRNYVVPELIVGIILLGVLPIDDLLRSARRHPRDRGG